MGTTKKGQDVKGNTVTETVEYVPENAAKIKQTFTAIIKFGKKAELQKRLDIAAVAMLALPIIEHCVENKLPYDQSAVESIMLKAAGRENMKSSEPGYQTFRRRLVQGVTNAQLAHFSPAHQLAPEAVPHETLKDDFTVVEGELQCHLNQLKSTFVFKADDGSVIDKQKPNTLEFNPDAEDWTTCPNQSANAHAVKLNIRKSKGADQNSGGKGGKSGDATDQQNPETLGTFMALSEFITGKSTGTVANISRLSKPELQAVLAAIEIANIAQMQGSANGEDNAGAYVRALIDGRKAQALDAVADAA